jgi:hypothetical protein
VSSHSNAASELGQLAVHCREDAPTMAAFISSYLGVRNHIDQEQFRTGKKHPAPVRVAPRGRTRRGPNPNRPPPPPCRLPPRRRWSGPPAPSAAHGEGGGGALSLLRRIRAGAAPAPRWRTYRRCRLPAAEVVELPRSGCPPTRSGCRASGGAHSVVGGCKESDAR